MRSSIDGTPIHYTLDPLNRRIAKAINGTITEKYLWQDLTTLLAVYDKDDHLLQRFEYADGRMPVAMTDDSGNRYYLHYDQVGSLRAISRVLSPDNTTEVIKEITYDTYGNIISDSNPSFQVPFGFAGGLYDSDTGLVHFGYREFDPFTGKWTAKDPLLFEGGDSNLYGYVLGDPVDLVDELGLRFDDQIYPYRSVPINPMVDRPDLSSIIAGGAGFLLWELQDHLGNNVCYAKGQGRSPFPPAKRKKYPTRKKARDAAQQAGKGKKPIHHPNGKKGPHYHPDVPMPDDWTPKSPNPHDHYYY